MPGTPANRSETFKVKKRTLIQHHDQQLAYFQNYFNKILANPGIEDIHQLRVSIKKLRTMWSLMQVLCHGKWKKKDHFILFEKLFRKAGMLREIQVNLSLIDQLNAPYLLPYAEYLEQEEKLSLKRLIRYMQEFDRKKLESLNDHLLKKMQNIPEQMVLKGSVDYVLKKHRKVLKIKRQLPNNRGLHKIRIQLKIIQELLAIIKGISGGTSMNKLQKEIKSINQCIGDWHDYSILLQSLKQFIKKESDIKHIHLINNFTERLEYQQEERKKRIYNLMDKYAAQRQLEQLNSLLL